MCSLRAGGIDDLEGDVSKAKWPGLDGEKRREEKTLLLCCGTGEGKVHMYAWMHEKYPQVVYKANAPEVHLLPLTGTNKRVPMQAPLTNHTLLPPVVKYASPSKRTVHIADSCRQIGSPKRICVNVLERRLGIASLQCKARNRGSPLRTSNPVI